MQLHVDLVLTVEAMLVTLVAHILVSSLKLIHAQDHHLEYAPVTLYLVYLSTLTATLDLQQGVVDRKVSMITATAAILKL